MSTCREFFRPEPIPVLFLTLFLVFFGISGKTQQTTWGFNIGSSAVDYAQHSYLDAAGNIYFCGEFRGSNVDFDPSAATKLHSSNGQCDGFVAKYSSTGQYMLSITLGGINLDKIEAVCTDAQGNIYISGFFRGTADFDPSGTTAWLTSNGENGGDPGYGGDMFLAKYTSTGQYLWAFNVGGSSLGDNGVILKTDGAGGVYVGGYFREAIDFDPSASTAILNSSLGTAFLVKYNSNGQYQWGLNFGGPDVDNTVFDLEVDATNNVFITGFFQGTNIDFDPSPAVAPLSSSGNFEAYVAKYTANGQYSFAFKIGGFGLDVGRGLALDNAGNVYVVGDFNGYNIDFDPSAAVDAFSSNGSSDVFVAKYTNSGQYVWAFNAGSGGGEIGWGITTDNTSVFITGGFSGVADFNPGPTVDNLTSNGGWDIFLAKYSTDGNYQCAFSVGAGSDDYGVDIQIAGNDRFYLTGGFVGNVDFTPTPSTYILNSNGSRDAFLVKYYWPPNTMPAGTIAGNNLCGSGVGQLTFTATAGTSPFTVVYTDGVTSFTQSNVESGVPFNLQVNPPVTTTYTVTSIQDGVRCSPRNNSPGINATVAINAISLSANNDTMVCKGGVAQLNVSGAQSYSWSPATGLSDPAIANPVATIQAPMQYIVTGTAASGCIGKDTVNILMHATPAIVVNNDTMICRNNTVQLSVTGGQAYSWTPAATLNNPNSATPVASPVANTVYYVTATDINTCQYVDSVRVSIRPDAVFSVSNSQDICVNKSAALQASGGDVYLWQPSTSLNQTNIANPLATPATSTTYTVTITESGCNQSQTLSTTVNVNPLPQISLSKSNDIDCSNDQSQLNASGALQYIWSPASTLNRSTVSNPVASPTTTTDYTAIGTDANGCADTAVINVKVTDANKGGYFVPSAFTPNNDGLNDCFRVSRWGVIDTIEFSIYNRWGERIFFTKDPSQCWDGTYKGRPQDPGVFVYMIKANTNCEKEVFRKGTVVLIR